MRKWPALVLGLWACSAMFTCSAAPESRLSSEGAVSNDILSRATHIILFIGDGMQLAHEIAGSRFWKKAERGLVWNEFSQQAYVTTWDIDTYNRYALARGQALYPGEGYEPDPYLGYDPRLGGFEPMAYFDHSPAAKTRDAYFLSPLPGTDGGEAAVPATDSASAATAIATGRKTTNGRIGCGPAPLPCESGSYRLITELLHEAGFGIGVVSTVPFSHATPAAFAAHAESRGKYRDIAAQMAEMDLLDVVIGGGHPTESGERFVSRETMDGLRARKGEIALVELTSGAVGDELLKDQASQAAAARKKLFGLFGRGPDGSFAHWERTSDGCGMQRSTEEDPTLAGAVEAALRVLSARNSAFFLMAEQGDIDWANHQDDYDWMVGAVGSLDTAVRAAVAFVETPGDDIDWNNTLLLVTADHGNSYMRLSEKDAPNHCLPPRYPLERPDAMCPDREASFDERRVTYGLCESTHSHTNELVSLYGKGLAVDWRALVPAVYPEAPDLMDNTQIFEIICSVAFLPASVCGRSRL